MSLDGFRNATADFIDEMQRNNPPDSGAPNKILFSPKSFLMLKDLSEYSKSTELWQKAENLPQTKKFQAEVKTAAECFLIFLTKVDEAPIMALVNSSAVLILPVLYEKLLQENIIINGKNGYSSFVP